MRIGILGGAFNPPHTGHLIIAQDILDALKLDKVFLFRQTHLPIKRLGVLVGRLG